MITLVATMALAILPLSSPRIAPRVLFPGNVVCSDFGKVDARTWDLRRDASLDLGNWDGEFLISGRITAGRFVAHGQDLFDVLEKKCEISALSIKP